MHDIPPALARLGWNRRVLTLDEFYEACAHERIRVIDDAVLPRRRPGSFFYRRCHPFIALDYRLRGPMRNLVAWHEFGHALLHCTGFYGHSAKSEFEARIISYVALIPLFLLDSYSNGEIAEMFRYKREWVDERDRIWKAYRKW
jgi:hypothetical protein